MSYKLKVEHVFYFIGVVALIAIIGLFIYPKIKAGGLLISAKAPGGDWSRGTTWDTGISPGALDSVSIDGGNIVNVDGTQKSASNVDGTQKSASMNIQNITGGNAILNVPETTTLENYGSFDISETPGSPANSSATFNINGTFTNQTAAGTVLNITSGGTGKTTTIDIGSKGIANIDGGFNFSGAVADIVFINDGVLYIKKNLPDGATFSGTGTTNFNGIDQTVGGYNYYNLTLSGSGTKTIGSAITEINSISIASGVKASLTGSSTTYGLQLDSVVQSGGTYGATGSGADNINDTYFSGTGTLRVISAPFVSTTSATSITRNTGTLYGNVSDDGGKTITARVLEYGKTIAYGTTVNSTADTGTFSETITGLNCDTLYHFRASATNAIGTTNGDDKTFTTGSCLVSSGGYSRVSPTSASAPVVTAPVKFVRIMIEQNDGTAAISIPWQVDCPPGEKDCPQALISSLKTPKLILGDPMKTTQPIFTCYDHPDDCISASFKMSFDQSLNETGKKVITDALNSSSKLGPWEKDNGKLGPWEPNNKTLNISVNSPESFSKLFPTKIIAKVSDPTGKVIDSFVLIGSPRLTECTEDSPDYPACLGINVSNSAISQKLFPPCSPWPGCEAENVSNLQTALNYILGINPLLIIDGKIGSQTKDAVKIFQEKIKIGVDGIPGKQTWNAIKAKLIAQDGIGTGMKTTSSPRLTECTEDSPDYPACLGINVSNSAISQKLFPPCSPWPGCEAENVSNLQTALNYILGINPLLIIDGKIGSQTKDAVKIFQEKIKIGVDGIPGKQTWEAVKSKLIKLEDTASGKLILLGVDGKVANNLESNNGKLILLGVDGKVSGNLGSSNGKLILLGVDGKVIGNFESNNGKLILLGVDGKVSGNLGSSNGKLILLGVDGKVIGNFESPTHDPPIDSVGYSDPTWD